MQQTLKKCLCAEKRQATGTNNPSTIASSRIHHSKLSRSAQTPQPHPLQSVRREHLNSRPRQPRTSTVCPKHSPNFWDTASPKTSAHPLGSFWQMACGVNNLFSVEGRRNWGMGQLLELRTQDKENFQLKPRNSVQLVSRVQLFATPWTAARQASLSITNSWSLLKLMSIEFMMQSNSLILCHPLLLPPSIFSSIRVFSNESILCIRWPKYWSFSFSISPSKEYSGLISFRMDWLSLPAVQGTLKSLL